ncbi:hypothetical protein [Maribacter forsetii]|uniref:hypothetical protein n=1 Tax=Maribacter forsetii TaxID=444515 RepID=UPI00056D2DE9|nr:hypothetical protein [Maribacter forsetii]
MSYQSNVKKIKDKVYNRKVNFVELSNDESKSKLGEFIANYSYIDLFHRNLKKLLLSKEENNITIIFLQTTPKIIYFIRNLEVEYRVLYVFHRAFNDRSSKEYLNPLGSSKKDHSSILNKTFKHGYNRVKYFLEKNYLKYFDFLETLKHNENIIVFSDSKKSKIVNTFPHIEKSITVWPFYYNFKEFDFDNLVQRRLEEQEISLIKLGVINSNKGIETLKKVIIATNNSHIKWYGIGPMTPLNYIGSDLTVYCKSSNQRQYQFENSILNKTFSIILHKKEFIEEIVSGTFYDAINYGLPIFCIRNTFFENMFEIYGDIGYMFDSLESLILFLNKFNLNKEKYLIQVDNVLKCKVHLINELNASSLNIGISN